MMKMPMRKADLKKIVDLMESGAFATAEDLAAAILEVAYEQLQERGKFTVVGQLRFSLHDGGYLDAEDARASKVCLGLFATAGDAEKAAASLRFSMAHGEEFRAWVLPVEHATASEVYDRRKQGRRKRAPLEVVA